MPDLFTLPELVAYMGEDIDETRGALIVGMTLGLVYDTVPEAVADASPQAKAVGLEVAARALRNAQGYASERIDDYSYNRPASTAYAGVYLTDDERAKLLAVAAGGSRSRVRSVRLRSWAGPA